MPTKGWYVSIDTDLGCIVLDWHILAVMHILNAFNEIKSYHTLVKFNLTDSCPHMHVSIV